MTLQQSKGPGEAKTRDNPLTLHKEKGRWRASGANTLALLKGNGWGRESGIDPLTFPKKWRASGYDPLVLYNGKKPGKGER